MRTLLRIGCALLALGLSSSLSATTFTVNSTTDTDDGLCNAAHCSLREAIDAANAMPGADTIRFVIGSGARTIQPTSALPTITDPVTIDGTTQPGFGGTPIIELDGSLAGTGANGLRISAGSSLVTGLVINRFQVQFPANGGNGILLESGGGNEVRGCYIGTSIAGNAALGNSADGIVISGSPGNLIGRTLPANRINVISGNVGNGVRIAGGGANQNIIAGNRLGTTAAGTGDLGNGINGVAVSSGSDNVVGSLTFGDTLIAGNGGDGVAITGSATGTIVQGCYIGTSVTATTALSNDGQGVNIGGATGNTVGQANIISGNLQSGVLIISGASGNTVTGNFVGVSATGAAALGNALNGVIVSGANGNTVGPNNLISGNGTNGVRIRSGASGNIVKGNVVGTNAAITAALPNVAEGVQLNDGATTNTVGGPGPDRNVISGNGANGVLFLDATTTGNFLQGNFIGTNATASAALPNAGNGVAVQADSSGNTIGGTVAGTKNVISLNTGRGVFVESGTGNAILGNTISYNGSLGIDLGPAGVTPNDAGDPDPGANLLQNFPLLSAVVLDASLTQIQGSLNSLPSANYRVEFFANLGCDASGNGQGQRPLGFVDRATDPGGNVAFVAALPVAATGPWITATATDAAGNTSEFSACIPVPGPSVASITPTSGPAAGGTPVSIAGANFQTGAAVHIGGVAAGLVSVVSGVEVDASTPALPPGTLNDVVVTNPSLLVATLAGGWMADFSDVPQANIFHGYVEKVFRNGITAGCGGGNYCVDSAVTRAQMAVFLLKAKHGAAYTPPACTPPGIFGDVPCPGSFTNWIEQLSAEGVTAGCGGGNYCPGNSVTRAQMAVFLLKALLGGTYVPPMATGIFGDVQVGDFAADFIEDLYVRGITGGCQTSPLLYCPTAAATRGQMAVFLVTTFNLP